MRLQRTIAPAAAPVHLKDLLSGLAGIFREERLRAALEQEFRSYFGSKHVFFVSSGKAALFLIIEALKALNPGRRKVVIPAYTCFSVPSSIVKAGLDVVPCDIAPENLDIDPELLEKELDDDELCVVSNHLFGIPSNVQAVKRICEPRGVPVVEDASQAMGVVSGVKPGTIGDVGFFSLGRGKNITCGSGGVIITRSDEIGGALRELCGNIETNGLRESLRGLAALLAQKLLIRPWLFWIPNGLPFLRLGETRFYSDFPVKRLSGVELGVLSSWKARLAGSNLARTKNSLLISECLGQTDKPAVPFLRLPVLLKSARSRDEVLEEGKRNGLGLSAMYPKPINEIKELTGRLRSKDFPVAKMCSQTILTFPTHPLLDEKDLNAISAFIGRSIRGSLQS